MTAIKIAKSHDEADKRFGHDYVVNGKRRKDIMAGDPTNLKSLEERLGGVARAGKIPPVDTWNPPYCGDIDMEIAADGTWFYQGTPIGRSELVTLFASILRKDEDGKTYLVTPVEKVGIRVVDAPLLAVAMDCHGAGDDRVISFRTLTGDIVAAGPDHRLRFAREAQTDGVKPYVHVRGRLEALVNRPVMYELIGLGETVVVDGVEQFAVRSNGCAFPIMTQAALDEALA